MPKRAPREPNESPERAPREPQESPKKVSAAPTEPQPPQESLMLVVAVSKSKSRPSAKFADCRKGGAQGKACLRELLLFSCGLNWEITKEKIFLDGHPGGK